MHVPCNNSFGVPLDVSVGLDLTNATWLRMNLGIDEQFAQTINQSLEVPRRLAPLLRGAGCGVAERRTPQCARDSCFPWKNMYHWSVEQLSGYASIMCGLDAATCMIGHPDWLVCVHRGTPSDWWFMDCG